MKTLEYIIEELKKGNLAEEEAIRLLEDDARSEENYQRTNQRDVIKKMKNTGYEIPKYTLETQDKLPVVRKWSKEETKKRLLKSILDDTKGKKIKNEVDYLSIFEDLIFNDMQITAIAKKYNISRTTIYNKIKEIRDLANKKINIQYKLNEITNKFI